MPLKKKGRNLWALCPFHKEKTPSFSVNPDKGIFKCFGCGEGGDVFSFVQKYEGVSFPESIRLLARRAGVRIPETGGQEESGEVRTPLYDANVWAAKLFHKWLTTSAAGKPALDYLTGRGVSQEAIKRYGLGYAPDSWDELLKQARKSKIGESVLIDAGLAVPKDEGGCYDRFRGRVMFPIFDPQKRVVGFGGRVFGDGEPKYLNTPETRLYQKGRLLYLAERAKMGMRETRRAIVVEGYMDAIMAHENDIGNTVAVLGTALTPDHVRYLKRFADEAVILFDGDSAGISSANRSLEALAEGELEARVCVLPDELDPCDFLQQRGREAFLSEMEAAPNGLQFRIRTVMDTSDSGSGLAKARGVDEAIELVARMPNPVSRSFGLDRLSQELGVSATALRERLDRALARTRRSAASDGEAPEMPRREAEQELIQVMLNCPETVPWVQTHLEPGLVRDETARLVAEEIFALRDAGCEPTAAEVLARLRDESARELVGCVMERTCENADPVEWCGQIVDRIRKRRFQKEAHELRREYREKAEGGADEEELLRQYLERKRLSHAKPEVEKAARDPVELSASYQKGAVEEEEVEY